MKKKQSFLAFLTIGLYLRLLQPEFLKVGVKVTYMSVTVLDRSFGHVIKPCL